MQRNRITRKPVGERPIDVISMILLGMAFGWWALQGFAERRDIEARQRAAIIRAEGGMSQ
jgi:hypothetical protein